MQVKVFPIDAAEQEVNDFLDAHKVVENGIVVREAQIVILYMKEQTEEESKIQKLKNTLAFFRDQFVGESVNYAYYLKLEMSGKGSMTLKKEVQTALGPQAVNTTVSQELTTAKASVESMKAQILVLEEMIATPPSAPVAADEPSVFGKKQYAMREKEGKKK